MSDLQLYVIEQIRTVQDEGLLMAILELIHEGNHEDDVFELADKDKLGIETGLAQIENGQTTPNKVVMKEFREWLNMN